MFDRKPAAPCPHFEKMQAKISARLFGLEMDDMAKSGRFEWTEADRAKWAKEATL